jgi:hypothetical protein
MRFGSNLKAEGSSQGRSRQKDLQNPNAWRGSIRTTLHVSEGYKDPENGFWAVFGYLDVSEVVTGFGGCLRVSLVILSVEGALTMKQGRWQRHWESRPSSASIRRV